MDPTEHTLDDFGRAIIDRDNLPVTLYRSKPAVKSCQMNGYCLLLRLKAECLLNNVKWVMNDSSMFSLIVWKMKCALHKLFSWQCLLFMSSSSIMLGCHAYQTLRRPEQSAKSKPALPTSSALTISW